MRGRGINEMNELTKHQEECLNILQEECAEVIQAASKIKRFGIYNRKEDAELNNLENLELELGDVLAMIDKCREAGIGITDEGLEKARLAKHRRLGLWMNTKLEN